MPKFNPDDKSDQLGCLVLVGGALLTLGIGFWFGLGPMLVAAGVSLVLMAVVAADGS